MDISAVRALRPARQAAGRWTAALPARGWLLLAALYAAGCWANVVTRAQWGLDSRFYLAWSWVYLGHSRAGSTALTHRALAGVDGLRGCYAACWPPDAAARFFGPDYGATVGPRALYPVLSAPFVALFGAPGMLVVPVVAFAGTVAVLVLFVSRRYGPHWALLAGAGLILPTTISRWSVTVMTEAPAMFVTTAILLVLPLSRATGRRQLWWYLVLLELGLFTRQYCEVVPVAVALAWLLVAVRDRRWRNPWLPFAGWGALAGAVTLWAQGQVATWLFGGPFSLVASFEQAVHDSLGLRVRYALPEILRRLAHGDYGYLRATDVLLLVVLGLALVGVLARFRSELSALAVGMFAATYALNVLVVAPTQFRYASPQYAYFLLAAIALVADLVAGRRPTTSTEATPGSPWHCRATPSRTPPARAGRLLVAALWLYAVWVVGTRPTNWTAARWLPLTGCLLAATAAVLLLALLTHRLLGATWALLVAATVPLCPAVLSYAVHPTAGAPILLLSTAALLTLPIATPPPTTPPDQPPAQPGTPPEWSPGQAGMPPAPVRDRLDGLPARIWTRLDGLGERWRLLVFAVMVVALVAISPAGLGLAGGVLAGWLANSLRRGLGGRPAVHPSPGGRPAVHPSPGEEQKGDRLARGWLGRRWPLLVARLRGSRAEPVRWRNRWLPYAVVAAVGTAGVTVLRSAGGIAARLGWPVPEVLVRLEVHRHGFCTGHGPAACAAEGVNRLVSADFRGLVSDRVLYAILVLAALALVLRVRHDVVALAVGAFATGAVVQLADGTLGFGDYLPAYPALLLAAAVLLRRVTAGWPGAAVRGGSGPERLDVRWLHFRRRTGPARISVDGLEPAGTERGRAD